MHSTNGSKPQTFTSGNEQPADSFWEGAARSRWGSYISEVERRAIEKADFLATQRGRALEIGCEGGRWSRLLSTLGWDMVCTDTDSNALGLCQNRIPSARCVLVKPEDKTIPCPDYSLGLILCIEVSPVLPDSDWFIGEAGRVLTKDGLIVATFFNRFSYRGWAAHWTASLRKQCDYYRFSYRSWQTKLRQAGFAIRHEDGFCWFPFRRQSNCLLISAASRIEKGLGLRKLTNVSPWVVFVAQKI